MTPIQMAAGASRHRRAGLQVCAQGANLVMLIMDARDMQVFLSGNLKLGAVHTGADHCYNRRAPDERSPVLTPRRIARLEM